VACATVAHRRPWNKARQIFAGLVKAPSITFLDVSTHLRARLKKPVGLDFRSNSALRDLQFPGSAWELDSSSCSQQSNLNRK
jgi:hypothetical protein